MPQETVNIWQLPKADNIVMLAGWRQWADAGSISSRLPKYLVKETSAEKIGELRSDGFYLFQIPGTHDLVRPVVKLEEGYPKSLDQKQNELWYIGDSERGVVIFLGDEPHLDVDRYADAFLDAAKALGVKHIITFGGVYGELPYDKERTISCIYSLPELKATLADLAVNLSNYEGGSSIGTYLCHRAAQVGAALTGFYAFVPTYDFSEVSRMGEAIRLENDFMAWLGVMRRVNYLLDLSFDLSDLEKQSERLVRVVDAKVAELDRSKPNLGVQAYMDRLSAEFIETPFVPYGSLWEDELRLLFDEPDDVE